MAWLVGQGYRIRARNVSTHAGEIDVIAFDGETLCFLEVKARATRAYGPAIEAVTPRKQRRLARCAALALLQLEWSGPCRFDVLGLDQVDGEWQFTLIRDAFDAA